ncbi:hypothetical protein Slin15195_G018840 [Septoria linicola]|uniref:Uncharacterized protein n=1 Tax=Septoria linicola TaxID=215465 RepID=A0A9Q9ALC7_9PEZI|nr:hypothetical protein Slin15195_G018840 [Septoria linicola]
MSTPQGTILPRGHPDRFKPTAPTSVQSARLKGNKRKREEEVAATAGKRQARGNGNQGSSTVETLPMALRSSRSFAHITVNIPQRGRSNVEDYLREAVRVSHQGVFKLKGAYKISKGLENPPFLMNTQDMSEADVQAYYATAIFDFGFNAYRMPEWLRRIGPANARSVANIRVTPAFIRYGDIAGEEDQDWAAVLAARRSLRNARSYFKSKTPSWPRAGVVKSSLKLEGSGEVWTSDPKTTYREWYAAQGKQVPDHSGELDLPYAFSRGWAHG